MKENGRRIGCQKIIESDLFDVQEKKVEVMRLCVMCEKQKSDNRRLSYLPFDRITLNSLFSQVNALF
jgi:hypothetical protein